MKKIVLYGAGAVSKNIIKMLNPGKCQVIAIVDKNKRGRYDPPKKGLWWDIPASWGGDILSTQYLKDISFDYVLICSDLYQCEMRQTLQKLEIPNEKIINASNNDFEFDYRHFYMSSLYTRNASPSHEALVELTDCEIFDYVICRELMLRRKRYIEDFQMQINDDYVRLSTIELISARIRNMGLDGSIAEAGVYKGDTAKYINEMFPERKLYLFDTFDSFNKDVMSKENGNVSDSFIDTFKDTSAELVMNKMKYPEHCIIKKGVFPDTTAGLENEEWAFVSLDMDLYESTYSGLRFFWPKLQKHGYIIIHDCLHHQETAGRNAMPAGRAVDRFCEEEGINYVPVTDVYGSVVLTK